MEGRGWLERVVREGIKEVERCREIRKMIEVMNKN